MVLMGVVGVLEFSMNLMGFLCGSLLEGIGGGFLKIPDLWWDGVLALGSIFGTTYGVGSNLLSKLFRCCIARDRNAYVAEHLCWHNGDCSLRCAFCQTTSRLGIGEHGSFFLFFSTLLW